LKVCLLAANVSLISAAGRACNPGVDLFLRLNLLANTAAKFASRITALRLLMSAFGGKAGPFAGIRFVGRNEE
jgi:hypothetical protein